MNDSFANDPESDVTTSTRPVNISNADRPDSSRDPNMRDPNFPDLRAETAANAAQTGDPNSRAPLFRDNELGEFRSRWNQAQTEFVDDPRQAVQKADALVGSVVQRLSDEFSGERNRLEQQWDRGDNVSTEDLRQALKRYRSFFDRLLNV
jgi:hypothetical protein